MESSSFAAAGGEGAMPVMVRNGGFFPRDSRSIRGAVRVLPVAFSQLVLAPTPTTPMQMVADGEAGLYLWNVTLA